MNSMIVYYTALALFLAKSSAWETLADEADVFFRCVEHPTIIARANTGLFSDFEQYGETSYCKTLAIIA